MDGFLNISFWLLAIITVVSALLVSTMKNLSRAVIFLVLFFLGAAGLYFLLQAKFLALLQVMIYAGAVTVLFAFVIMLTPGLPGMDYKQTLNQGAGLIVAVLFVIVMFIAFYQMPGAGHIQWTGDGYDLADVGSTLLGVYLLPFELVSVVLLVALVGAVVYTIRGKERGDGEHGPK